jgi:hypothetical protein
MIGGICFVHFLPSPIIEGYFSSFVFKILNRLGLALLSRFFMAILP